eukprot:scaffold1256_cov150-Skeletonema_menzelii.AAC.13
MVFRYHMLYFAIVADACYGYDDFLKNRQKSREKIKDQHGRSEEEKMRDEAYFFHARVKVIRGIMFMSRMPMSILMISRHRVL